MLRGRLLHIRNIGLCLLIALAVSAGNALADDNLLLKVDPHWPAPLPHGWVLGEVSGITVDPQDHVWIVQRGTPPVIEFDPSGRVLQSWGGPGQGFDWPSNPHGIHLDPKGFVWLSGNGSRDAQFLKFRRDGSFVLQIGHPAQGPASHDVSRLGRPTDIAFDPQAREAFISDGYGNRRVIVFDTETGAYKRHWGAYGDPPSDATQRYDPKATPPRQFGRPVHCIKRSEDGLLYVCDSQNDRIQVFRQDGHFVTEWHVAPQTVGMGSVWDLAFSADPTQSLIFVADGSNEAVHILRRSDGVQIGAFGQPGRHAGQFHWLHSIAVDSHGDVFTTEVDGANRVQRFIPTAMSGH